MRRVKMGEGGRVKGRVKLSGVQMFGVGFVAVGLQISAESAK